MHTTEHSQLLKHLFRNKRANGTPLWVFLMVSDICFCFGYMNGKLSAQWLWLGDFASHEIYSSGLIIQTVYIVLLQKTFSSTCPCRKSWENWNSREIYTAFLWIRKTAISLMTTHLLSPSLERSSSGVKILKCAWSQHGAAMVWEVHWHSSKPTWNAFAPFTPYHISIKLLAELVKAFSSVVPCKSCSYPWERWC